RVNDAILNQVAYIDDDGTPVTRFDNNTVNTNWYHRGVEIIEADNIKDIGEPYSYYWAGTEYEYFFPHKPVIDSDGLFVDWNYDPQANHAPELSNATKPSLSDSYGNPSNYKIEFQSNPSGIMGLSIGIANSVYSEVIYQNDNLIRTAPQFKSEFGLEIPIFTTDGLQFRTMLNYTDVWTDIYGLLIPDLTTPDFEPMIAADNSGKEYLIAVKDNRLFVISPPNYQTYLVVEGDVTTAPIYFKNEVIIDDVPTIQSLIGFGTSNGLVVHQLHNDGTLSPLYVDNGNKAVLSLGYYHFWDNTQILTVIYEDRISEYDNQNLYIDGNSPLGFEYASNLYNFTGYQPVKDYFLCEEGQLLGVKTSNSELPGFLDYSFSKILNSKEYTNATPTNMALGKFGNRDNVLLWGAGNYLFAVVDNSLLEGFPVKFDDVSFKPKGYPRIVSGNVEMPVNNGYLTITVEGDIAANASYSLSTDAEGDYYYYNLIDPPLTNTGELMHLFTEDSRSVILSRSTIYNDNPVQYYGFRSFFDYVYGTSSTQITTFDAFIFPNPVKTITPRLRVYNPNGDCKYNIYDIAGNKVMTGDYEVTNSNNSAKYYDIPLSMKKMSSGVYFCILKDGTNTKKIKFAIEK
ncbi:MAG: T9SS type A sorting domain-containing protein, partial [Candidatus Cloacimonetes bacterium]|nr:T9SS type A sorting domain-containing protein [Candidatus Cloacimonadota bacterium]